MVEMGQIKVFVQKLGLKQGFLADTNMDYLTSEWPGTPNFKVDANFDMFPNGERVGASVSEATNDLQHF